MSVTLGSTSITFGDGYNQTTSCPKSWVLFNGTGGAGTNQTITGSYNVSSVYKNATADWTVNFTSSLGSAYYTYAGSSEDTARDVNSNTVTATSFRFNLTYYSVGGVDRSQVNVCMFI